MGSWALVAEVREAGEALLRAPRTFHAASPFNPVRCARDFAAFGGACLRLRGVDSAVAPFLASRAYSGAHWPRLELRSTFRVLRRPR